MNRRQKNQRTEESIENSVVVDNSYRNIRNYGIIMPNAIVYGDVIYNDMKEIEAMVDRKINERFVARYDFDQILEFKKFVMNYIKKLCYDLDNRLEKTEERLMKKVKEVLGNIDDIYNEIAEKLEEILDQKESFEKLKREIEKLKGQVKKLSKKNGEKINKEGRTAEYRLPQGVVKICNKSEDFVLIQYPDEYKDLELQNGITAIGNEVFSCRSKLESLRLPNSLVKIGWKAFYSCSRLKSIDFPDGVKEIGAQAFAGCKSLESIKLPDKILNIGNGVFKDCTSLKEINLPYSLKSIGKVAFANCTSLEKVVIPQNVEKIEENAFSGCTSLKEIIFEGSVSQCKKIKGIAACFPGKIIECNDGKVSSTIDERNKEEDTKKKQEKKEQQAQAREEKWDKLKPIVKALAIVMVIVLGISAITGAILYPMGFNSLGLRYKNDKELGGYVVSPGLFGINDEKMQDLVIPEKMYGKQVVGIAEEAFKGNNTIRTVTLPKTIKKIGISSFQDCSGLESITIPDKVTSIEDGAFSGCSRLENITIPDRVTSIGDGAFSGCSRLENITIPDRVTSIGDGAFSGCYGLKSITIPDSVTSIGDNAFYGCNSLTSIIIPGRVTSIGDNAFYGCSSLESIIIPDSVTSIGWRAFTDCSSLKSITLPFIGANKDGGENTHFGYIFGAIRESDNDTCVPTSLKSLIVTSVTSIGDGAFSGCYGLESITIPDSVTSIGDNAFYGCNSLTSIIIPDRVTSIGKGAFAYCSNLRDITITDRTNREITIGRGVFDGCNSLTNMTLPFTITYNNTQNVANDNRTQYNITDTVALSDLSDYTGYEFDCWLDENGNEITSIAQGTNGDITLTAKWKAKVYTITVEGMDVNPSNQTDSNGNPIYRSKSFGTMYYIYGDDEHEQGFYVDEALTNKLHTNHFAGYYVNNQGNTNFNFGGLFKSVITNNGHTYATYPSNSCVLSSEWALVASPSLSEETRTGALYVLLTPKRYTITLNANTSSQIALAITNSFTTSTKAYYNEKPTNIATMPQGNYYSSTAFATQGGTSYFSDAGVSTRYYDISGDTTMYCQWVQKYTDCTYIYDKTTLEAINVSGKYLIICDINMNGAIWTPKESFSGEIDGDGHCVYNFSISKTGGSGTAIIAFIKNNTGTIKDFIIGKAGITSYDGKYSVKYNISYTESSSVSYLTVGGLVGENSGTITGCKLLNTYINATFADNDNDEDLYLYVGGIATINSGTISSCHVENSNIDANATCPKESGDDNYAWLGGICGKNSGTLSQCTVKATTLDLDVRGDGFWKILSDNDAYPWGALGGIVGEQLQGTTTSCSVSGNILNIYGSEGSYTHPTLYKKDVCGLTTGGTIS